MLETQKEPSLQVEIMFGNGLRPQIWQQFVSRYRYLHKKTVLVAPWQSCGSALIFCGTGSSSFSQRGSGSSCFLNAYANPDLQNL